mmetsp:Transcript_17137/g.30708  ORF Transcript_17137/g.30708 Transcript_17137/m.30708 type:complete len:825 (+) Transcript_17137:748-3222(+)
MEGHDVRHQQCQPSIVYEPVHVHSPFALRYERPVDFVHVSTNHDSHAHLESVAAHRYVLLYAGTGVVEFGFAVFFLVFDEALLPVLLEAHDQRVGAQRSEASRAQKTLQAGPKVGRNHGVHEATDLEVRHRGVFVVAVVVLLVPVLLHRGLVVALHHVAEHRDAVPLPEASHELRQRQPVRWVSGHHEVVRAEGLDVRVVEAHAHHGLLHIVKVPRLVGRAPVDGRVAVVDVVVQAHCDRDGGQRDVPAGQEHDGDAQNKAEERGPLVEVDEVGPPRDAFADFEREGGDVDEPVSDHEEHRDQRRDGVQRADQNAARRHDVRQEVAPNRTLVALSDLGEGLDGRNEVVLSYGHQDTRRADQRRETRRERRREDAGQHERPSDVRHRDDDHDQRVHVQPVVRAFVATSHDRSDADRHQHVHHSRHGDCPEGTLGNVFGGVFEVSGDVGAGHDPRHCREEHGEYLEEVVAIAELGHQVVHERGRVEPHEVFGLVRRRDENAQHHRDDRTAQQAQQPDLEVDHPPSSDVCHHQQNGDKAEANNTDVVEFVSGESGSGKENDRLTKTDHVQSDSHRLAQREQNADGASDSVAETSGNEVVSTARSHFAVGADRRHGQRGDGGHDVGQDDDHKSQDDARLTHHPRQSQKHDDSEDVEQARHEHAVPGAKLLGLGALLRFLLDDSQRNLSLFVLFDILSESVEFLYFGLQAAPSLDTFLDGVGIGIEVFLAEGLVGPDFDGVVVISANFGQVPRAFVGNPFQLYWLAGHAAADANDLLLDLRLCSVSVCWFVIDLLTTTNLLPTAIPTYEWNRIGKKKFVAVICLLGALG